MCAVVDDDRGEGDSAEVGEGVFVVAGRDAASVFEPVEAALDGVAFTVDRSVEAWWSSAVRALCFAPRDLVAAFGDGVRDLPRPQRFSR